MPVLPTLKGLEAFQKEKLLKWSIQRSQPEFDPAAKRSVEPPADLEPTVVLAGRRAGAAARLALARVPSRGLSVIAGNQVAARRTHREY